MGTVLYYSSSSSAPFQLFNQTSIDDDYSSDNHMLHLLIYIAVWIVLVTTIVCGSIGNILVLYVYVNRNDSKTCTFFIKMLAIVDLVICFVLAPLELYQTTTGIHNELLCKFYGFLNTHVLYSTFLITTIAFDRYFCICWPLYKIITIQRARIIVILCGLLSSLFAIIPMSEYSTIEHVLQLHNNHSDQLTLGPYQEGDSPVYTDVESIKASVDKLPFTIGNITNVKCSPRFSLHLRLASFLMLYRIFHGTLFVVCLALVASLYVLIYNAIYQRRRTRARKIIRYQKILQSYLINDEQHRQRIHRHSLLVHLCSYCCQKIHSLQSSQQSFDEEQKNKFSFREQSLMLKRRPEQIVLEINGARGKRYSAVSMTSMTYFTSGVWDETSPPNLISSRLSSIAATTYCGADHSTVSRPSTSTEDSFDQSTRLSILNNPSSQAKPFLSPSSTYLKVPGQQIPGSTSSYETNSKDNHLNDTEPSGTTSQCVSGLHPTVVRKSSHTLLIRQPSAEVPVNQRKVPIFTSDGTSDRCIIEDLPSTSQPLKSNSPPLHTQLLTPISHQHSFSGDLRRNSISSTRRGSTFDDEARRIFERQQKQERSANIRTTLTLCIVTATFILMYLPSIVITLFNVRPSAFWEVFYLLYYINSACNPLIYSFFNVNFRNDIRRIYECQRRVYLARQC